MTYHEHVHGEHVMNALLAADTTGVGLYARQASEFAPEADRAEDLVCVVLSGQRAVELGRKTLTEVADLVREALP